MREAIELAKKGTGRTNPNPLVGAVIVQQNQIIGQGFHHKYGDLHAERDALRDCLERGNDPSGATMFVTLEPCCHTGKQPPCVEAIVQAKIKKSSSEAATPTPLSAEREPHFCGNTASKSSRIFCARNATRSILFSSTTLQRERLTSRSSTR